MTIQKVARIGKVGAIKDIRPPKLKLETGFTGGGIKQLDVLPEAMRVVERRIGMSRAKRVWKLQRGGVVGTLPELCAYEWLERRKVVFEFQSGVMGGRRQSGGAVIDFLISGLSLNGLLIWRIQGEYWHQGTAVEIKDEYQKQRLRNLTIGGLPVVAVVDLWEDDVYDRYPQVFERAEVGDELRG